MKLKELFYLFGLKPKTKSYGHEVVRFSLPLDGDVEFAHWLHPKNVKKPIQQEAVDALRAFLRPGDVAIDIGAHSGDTTVPMALAVGIEGRVLALEPNRFVYPVLEKNAALNRDKTRITPLMFAATPVDGPIEFEYSDSGFCNGGRHEGISAWKHAHAFKLSVDGRQLERYLREHHADLIPRIRYIKVDAEGYDFSVLETLVPLLREVRPFIRAEVFKHLPQERRSQFISFLEALDYDVFRMESDVAMKGERIGPADVMRWKHFDVFCVPHVETARAAAENRPRLET